MEFIMLLDQILFHVPCPIFWKNLEGNFLGCNKLFLTVAGFDDYSQLANKKDDELPWKQYSDHYYQDDQYVIKTGKTITRIEPIPFHNREIISETTKCPLLQDGKIIGVLGICLDITDRKEAERLKLENEKYLIAELELQKKIVEQKEKFTSIAAQVAHDIRSPLASLQILLKACQDIPEKERIALREATMRIQDIANNLLSHYSQKDINTAMPMLEEREPLLVSVLLASLLSEKKLQYQDLEVKFIDQFSQSGNFAFIQAQASSFKRMISNLINNAVEALDNKAGNVTLRLVADNEQVDIVIEDNGKGMQLEMIEKIRNSIAFTEGKEQGHGLGLIQVCETLQHNHGEFLIESQYGAGTKITLTSPRIQAPAWIAEKIRLREDSILIILDDDQSIHAAWDSRFESIVKENPDIRLIHFTQGEEALLFIQDLSQQEKRKVFLLSDYELLKQHLTGLDIIEESGIKKAVLVTSHYASQEIRERAAKIGTKILPKLLASEIPIILKKQEEEEEPTGPVEIVIIDDNQSLLNVLIYNFSLKNRVVEGFSNPCHFLNRLAEFPKNIKICFDYDFKLPDIDGFELARQLHKLGYTKLYMLTGMGFEQNDVPSYLTLISKDKAVDLLGIF